MIGLPLLAKQSRSNGDRRSQIEKHVIVSVRSNMPKKAQQSFLNQMLDPPIKIPRSALGWRRFLVDICYHDNSKNDKVFVCLKRVPAERG